MPPRNKSNQKKSTSKESTPMPTKSSPKPTKTTTKKPAIQRNSSLEERGLPAALEQGMLLLLVVQQKKVHTKSITTGFGLTDEDRKAGISTINEKLERMCPHYHVIKDLMEGQAIYQPLVQG
ncbi:hypothetical protein VP01_5882g1 [Puccinia sorghi]|uniref:Uncharacterized protein n=1 Tax=Puccinia sorghi TaxID=27349 RepID=A0A0L6UIM8_9BASI|nr:hypothetical protein VP01_5882g1 [Puccinia sorghi]